MSSTLYQKIVDAHLVEEVGQDLLLYADRHLIHDVTTPQAFSGLQEKNITVRCPDLTFGTMDHSISTKSLAMDTSGPLNELQLNTLADPP